MFFVGCGGGHWSLVICHLSMGIGEDVFRVKAIAGKRSAMPVTFSKTRLKYRFIEKKCLLERHLARKYGPRISGHFKVFF